MILPCPHTDFIGVDQNAGRSRKLRHYRSCRSSNENRNRIGCSRQLRAFEAVLADLRTLRRTWWSRRRFAYGGAHPAEIVDQVRALGWPASAGIRMRSLVARSLNGFAGRTPQLGPLRGRIQDLIPPTLAMIGEERLRWLGGFPERYDGEGFSLVHASRAICGVLPCPMRAMRNCGVRCAAGSAIAVYGHIHRPYIRRVGEMTVANSGSVSQSYDGDRRLRIWCRGRTG